MPIKVEENDDYGLNEQSAETMAALATDEQPLNENQSFASQIVEGGCYQSPQAGRPGQTTEVITLIVVILVNALFALWQK